MNLESKSIEVTPLPNLQKVTLTNDSLNKDSTVAPNILLKKTGTADLKNVLYYRKELMPLLSKDIFKANPARLVGFGISGGVAISAFFLIATLNPAWYLKLVLGLTIGICTGTLGFLTHELLHGAITRNLKLQNFLGFFGLMPYLISPTYWKYIHNRLHHNDTQRTIKDPDAFPILKIYKHSKFVKAIFPFTPGSGYKRSYFYFFFWLSFHEFTAQMYHRFRNGIFKDLDHKKVTIELTLQILILSCALIYAGPSNWLWILVIPIATQNYMLMSYISTNHNLSPLTSENDPLVNSLTVTNHPLLEWFSLDFGYHVEHHLFPTISSKHAKKVHEALKTRFPENYKFMPKWDAIKLLYGTSRIYKNSTTLINPETLKEYQTI